MNTEEVCLRWNNFSSNITKNIDDLWKDESLVDVTICSEGKSIQAHKIILSASSPLFKGIFALNPCRHPVVILQDVKYRELSAIIAFIYKGEVNIDQQYLPELLQAAHTLQIRGLSDSVGTINNDVTPTPQHSAKKRKVQSSENEEIETFQQEPVLVPKEEYPFPKEEVDTSEFIPPDIETHLSDEDDVKNNRLDCNIGENSQIFVPPTENHGFALYNPFSSDVHYPQRVNKRRRCRVCSLNKIRMGTWYVCDICRDNKNQEIGLCPAPCFALFHQK